MKMKTKRREEKVQEQEKQQRQQRSLLRDETLILDQSHPTLSAERPQVRLSLPRQKTMRMKDIRKKETKFRQRPQRGHSGSSGRCKRKKTAITFKLQSFKDSNRASPSVWQTPTDLIV